MLLHPSQHNPVLVDRLALLLTTDGVDVQDQGWELLRSFPEISLHDVQASMVTALSTALLLRGVPSARLSQSFTRRFFALRRFCDLFELPWHGARIQVNLWPRSSPTPGRIRLNSGWYDICGQKTGGQKTGRHEVSRDNIGDYAIVSVPPAHPLRTGLELAQHFGGMFHDRFMLSPAGTLALSRQHPASRSPVLAAPCRSRCRSRG